MKKKAISKWLFMVMTLTLLSGCAIGNGSLSGASGDGSDITGEDVDQGEQDTDEYGVSSNAFSDESCPQALLYSDYYNEYSEDGTVQLFTGQFETISLDEKSSETYTALAATLNKKRLNDISRFDNESKDYIDDAKEYYEDAGEYFRAVTLERNIYPRRSDSKVFTYLSVYYQDLGGAHGSTMYGGYNFDTASGKELTLDDVIADKNELIEEIFSRVKADYPDLVLSDYDDENNLKSQVAEYITGEYTDSIAWVLDPYAITFCFGDYALGAYASGHQIISIPYADKPGLFKSDYSPITDRGYIVSFPTWMDNNFDVDGDGKTEKVMVGDSGIYDEYNDYYDDTHRSIDVYINDENYNIAEDWDVYGVTSRVAIMPSGREYLMVTESLINDYTATKIYAYSENELSVIKENSFDPLVVRTDEDEYASYALLDTDELFLMLRFDRLATFEASRTYRMNDDATLTSDEEYYMIVTFGDANFELTTLMDITADIVDEDGNVVESSVNLPKGTAVYLYRTSGERNYEDYHDVIVEGHLEDGRIVRFIFTEGDWPHKVNGIDENEVFDGLLYAG